jgi:basic membrane protein A and related proteins
MSRDPSRAPVRAPLRPMPLRLDLPVDRRHVLRIGGGAALALAAPGIALAQKAKPIKVAAIYTVPVEQQWVSRIHKALNAAKDRGDVTYKWSENTANTDYERVMRQFSTEGSDLILGESFAVERAARKVAADFPKIAYLMGSSFGPSKPNFAVFDNFIHEPSYLTGMVAGKSTKSNVIGMVGGYAIPEVNRLMNAFMDGALSVNKDVKFYVTFINSWYDPPKAKEAAFAMIDKKADILYAERFGVSDAAKERGVKAIGNVIDTAAQYPGVILASALWHMEPTIDRAIKNVMDGTFEPSDYGPFSYMAHGGASLSPLDDKLVPKDVIELVKAKEKEILEGAFRVNVNDAEPKSSA